MADMNWHEVIDERNYEMHQVIADLLRRDPAKLQRANRWIDRRMADPEYSVQLKGALREWLDLMEGEGLEGVLRVLTDRDEDATRMRQSSPFACLMPQDERTRIMRRYESLRARAHPAGV